jgi:PAS domain S-box-containing protein
MICHVTDAQRRSYRWAAWARRAAPLAVIVGIGVAGGVATTHAVDTDRHRAAQRRAELTAREVRSALDRVRSFAVGLGGALKGEPTSSSPRFAELVGSATGTVGLTTALWVEEVPARNRRAYERRIGGPITALSGQQLARGSVVYLPATFVTGVGVREGTDVSGVSALAETLREPTSVFAGTATPIATLAGRQGFFVVQGARFGRGPGSGGFLVVFVPSGWLSLSLADDVRRLAISLGGRRLEGGLDTAPEAGENFEGLTQRWRVGVDREPATAVQAALPWIAVLWPLATALIVYLVARGIVRRRRAERVVDDLFELSLDLLCVAGLDGWFKRVNPAFEQTLGYTTRELLSRPLRDFVHPDDRESTQDAIRVLGQGGDLGPFVNRFLRSDGVIRWLQWSARALPERGLVYAAARDVTDNRVLTNEQTALRRVATLVAGRGDPADLFEAVAVEVGQLLDADATRLMRYQDDGTAAVVAGYGVADPALDVDARLTVDRSQSLLEWGAGAAVTAPIVVSGRTWGIIVAAFKRPDAVRPDTEARMARFTELVATAVANAQSRAELTASRRRIVETADETRRRIERDLHDGAQQRLVHTIITLELARSALSDDGPSAQLVDQALEHAQQAIAETRELAQGIHPAVLSRFGLVPALEDIVLRSPVPITLEAHIDGRLPPSVEVTAYFVVSEALTNVAKHAKASSGRVKVDQRNGLLRLEITDDGVGGADPTRGSGLVGLNDRVEANGGTLSVESRPGEGTRLDITLPLRVAEPADAG